MASAEAVARRRPSGLNARSCTAPRCSSGGPIGSRCRRPRAAPSRRGRPSRRSSRRDGTPGNRPAPGAPSARRSAAGRDDPRAGRSRPSRPSRSTGRRGQGDAAELGRPWASSASRNGRLRGPRAGRGRRGSRSGASGRRGSTPASRRPHRAGCARPIGRRSRHPGNRPSPSARHGGDPRAVGAEARRGHRHLATAGTPTGAPVRAIPEPEHPVSPDRRQSARPSGLKAMARTAASWRIGEASIEPVATSQSRAVRSAQAVARRRPSGLNATRVTASR